LRKEQVSRATIAICIKNEQKIRKIEENEAQRSKTYTADKGTGDSSIVPPLSQPLMLINIRVRKATGICPHALPSTVYGKVPRSRFLHRDFFFSIMKQ
jgi:hypothetical protein